MVFVNSISPISASLQIFQHPSHQIQARKEIHGNPEHATTVMEVALAHWTCLAESSTILLEAKMKQKIGNVENNVENT